MDLTTTLRKIVMSAGCRDGKVRFISHHWDNENILAEYLAENPEVDNDNIVDRLSQLMDVDAVIPFHSHPLCIIEDITWALYACGCPAAEAKRFCTEAASRFVTYAGTLDGFPSGHMTKLTDQATKLTKNLGIQAVARIGLMAWLIQDGAIQPKNEVRINLRFIFEDVLVLA